MGVIDSFFINMPNIINGAQALSGKRKYFIAEDENGDVICMFYDTQAGEQIVKVYIQRNNIKEEKVNFVKKTFKNNSPTVRELLKFQLVVLDKKQLVIFKDIQELAKENKIKKFDGKLPYRYKLYQFESVEK